MAVKALNPNHWTAREFPRMFSMHEIKYTELQKKPIVVKYCY